MRQKKIREPKKSLEEVLKKAQDPASGFNKLLKYLKKRACSSCRLSAAEIQIANGACYNWVFQLGTDQALVAKIKIAGLATKTIYEIQIMDAGSYLGINQERFPIHDVDGFLTTTKELMPA